MKYSYLSRYRHFEIYVTQLTLSNLNLYIILVYAFEVEFNLHLIFRGPLVVIVWQLDLQLHVQSEPIITKVVSLNPAHGEVYSMQHYVIKFVSYFRQVSGFLRVLWFPPDPPINLTNITEILLKVALNTIGSNQSKFRLI